MRLSFGEGQTQLIKVFWYCIISLWEGRGRGDHPRNIFLGFICGLSFNLRQDVTVLFQKMFDFNFGKTCNLVWTRWNWIRIFPRSQRCLCWLNGKENILCQTCQCRLNLKVTKQWRRKCYMHNNWQANRAWNKFEDKKVIIAKGPLSNPTHLTTGHHLLQISGGGGVPDHLGPPCIYAWGSSASQHRKSSSR